MMENTGTMAANGLAINKAKRYQVILFPFNNAATNCYFALLSFILYYGGYYLSGNFMVGIAAAAISAVVTTVLPLLVMSMRIFDGITDPIIGAMMDKTNGRFGKFRPFMIIGNIIMAISILLMFFAIRPVSISWLRWALFILLYVIFILGYTCQCACTKAGQNAITNDPKQRSQFIIWNMMGMIGSIVLVNIIGGGLLPIFVEPINAAADLGVEYNPAFYDILVPVVIVLSAIYTALACIAIWKKDRPEYWGVDPNAKPAKFKDYINLIAKNSQIRWLVLSSGCNKLASTIATSSVIAVLIYGIMMNNYNGLFMPMYALSFVFMGIFFFFGAKTAGRKGQKRAVTQYTAFAIIFYIGLIVLLSVWDPNNSATHLTLFTTEGGFKLTINFFTIAWIIMFGCGYGAYNCCAEMCIPMVADCTDYETYRSGKFVPGIMGTIFSLIDKIVSSLQTILITWLTVGLIPALGGKIPSNKIVITDFTGVKLSAILCFCVIPIAAWLVTLICMFFYRLSGEKLKEVQAVNAVRKAAVSGGMSMEDAMKTWVTIDQVPAEYVHNDNKAAPVKKGIFDKIYHAIWGRREHVLNIPSSNPVPIPDEYALR